MNLDQNVGIYNNNFYLKRLSIGRTTADGTQTSTVHRVPPFPLSLKTEKRNQGFICRSLIKAVDMSEGNTFIPILDNRQQMSNILSIAQF
jgi:hypothetical protein